MSSLRDDSVVLVDPAEFARKVEAMRALDLGPVRIGHWSKSDHRSAYCLATLDVSIKNGDLTPLFKMASLALELGASVSVLSLRDVAMHEPGDAALQMAFSMDGHVPKPKGPKRLRTEMVGP